MAISEDGDIAAFILPFVDQIKLHVLTGSVWLDTEAAIAIAVGRGTRLGQVSEDLAGHRIAQLAHRRFGCPLGNTGVSLRANRS